MKLEVERALEILERTPSIVEAALSGLSEEWLSAREGEGTFSPRDVLGHLIHGEETDWVPRLELILETGEGVPFTPFDRFGFRGKIEGRSIQDLLDEFSRLRRENLDFVRSLELGPSDLDRRGRHPALGTVTLGQLLAAWVVHDLGHVRQIVRVLARQYDEAVGPWKEYLSILSKPPA
jgi:hypothetical protein